VSPVTAPLSLSLHSFSVGVAQQSQQLFILAEKRKKNRNLTKASWQAEEAETMLVQQKVATNLCSLVM